MHSENRPLYYYVERASPYLLIIPVIVTIWVVRVRISFEGLEFLGVKTVSPAVRRGLPDGVSAAKFSMVFRPRIDRVSSW